MRESEYAKMKEIDYAKVGKKMKELRSGLGVTQERVAQDLGCTIAFISNVENHRAKLNLRLLLYYSWLCNVSVDTFLNAGRDGLTEDEKDAHTDGELLRLFHSLSKENRKKVIKTLQIWTKG